MRWLVSGVITLLLLLGSARANAMTLEAPEPPELSLHEVVWQTALLVLAEQGLTVHSASVAEGRITTAFMMLDPEALSATTLLSNPDRGSQWAGAEYRLDIDLGRRTNRVRIAVTAEIWAWERQEPTATPGPEAKRPLQSSRALEWAFLAALTGALGQVSPGSN
jgi:hypothetical protein